MPLPRMQLFELEDLAWFPQAIRDLATDYLRFMEALFALHKPAVPLVRRLLEKSGAVQVIDLCSGGGGPVLAVYEALVEQGLSVPFTLTDKYPNLEAFRSMSSLHAAGISYIADSVDATKVPRDLVGLRTMFNSFHHFAPAAARSVLARAVEAGQPIGIFEIPDRSPATIMLLLFAPLFVVAATPFIRPFRWRRLLWTYVFPLVPLTSLWDGVVSQWRAYTVQEMLELTRGLGGYEWTAARVEIEGKIGHLTYLLGVPKSSAPVSILID